MTGATLNRIASLAAVAVAFCLAAGIAGAAEVDPRWQWSLSTLIAAVGLLLVMVGNTAAAVVFFLRWSTSLQLLRADVEGFKSEVRDDLKAINGSLASLATQDRNIAVIQAELQHIRTRVRALEARQRRALGLEHLRGGGEEEP